MSDYTSYSSYSPDARLMLTLCLAEDSILLDEGIAVSAGVSPITGLIYNGSALTAADVEEATAMDLSAGNFVRWVAADLVLAGDNTRKSVDTFTLKASGKKETSYKIRIVEPE